MLKGRKFFPFKVDLFSGGVWCEVNKQKVRKVISIVKKMAENISSVSSLLNIICFVHNLSFICCEYDSVISQNKYNLYVLTHIAGYFLTGITCEVYIYKICVIFTKCFYYVSSMSSCCCFCRTCVSTQVRYRRAVTRPFVRSSTIDL